MQFSKVSVESFYDKTKRKPMGRGRQEEFFTWSCHKIFQMWLSNRPDEPHQSVSKASSLIMLHNITNNRSQKLLECAQFVQFSKVNFRSICLGQGCIDQILFKVHYTSQNNPPPVHFLVNTDITVWECFFHFLYKLITMVTFLIWKLNIFLHMMYIILKKLKRFMCNTMNEVWALHVQDSR